MRGSPLAITQHRLDWLAIWLSAGESLDQCRRSTFRFFRERVAARAVLASAASSGGIKGGYVKIGELQTWYDEQGAGEPLVLLHGGLSTNETWAAQMPDFGAHFRVIAPERRGHGHTPDVEGPLSYDVMAADTISFLDVVVGGAAHLVGWSDGGIVGLLVAMARPDLVRKLVAISANFDTSGLVPDAMEGGASMTADSDDLAVFRTPYEAASPDGPGHWPVVFAKFQEMVSTQPSITVEQLGRISAPTLVLAGDDDMISLEHTSVSCGSDRSAHLTPRPADPFSGASRTHVGSARRNARQTEPVLCRSWRWAQIGPKFGRAIQRISAE